MNLTLYIDHANGITIDDCEKVSLAVDPLIDESGIMNDEQYNLNVASLGLDWPIVDERDFVRNHGKKIDISLFAKQDGKKDFTGTLAAWTTDTVTIDIDGNQKEFIRKDIAHIAQHIDL